jgi:toxin ParE1/3/4
MPRIVRTSRAELDLAEIWTFIAEDNPDAADGVIRRIDTKLRLLSESPAIGEKMDRYRVGLRSSLVGNYVIYFREIEDGIEVYRVLHAARRQEDQL